MNKMRKWNNRNVYIIMEMEFLYPQSDTDNDEWGTITILPTNEYEGQQQDAENSITIYKLK